jgi:hypothetical protein
LTFPTDASEDAAVRSILTALGQVIGAKAMAALIAAAQRACDRQGQPPPLVSAIKRSDPATGKALVLTAEAGPIIAWVRGFPTVSVGVVATLLHDFAIIAPDGRGQVTIHPAAEHLWPEIVPQLPPEPQPGIALSGFAFGPSAQDDVRFSARQSAQHAAALGDRMRD